MSCSFNEPHITGKEIQYMSEVLATGKLSGNGTFTKRCQQFFEKRYGFPKCLLTTSCTDALEMAAILCDLTPEDEVIIPSFTFVSTALAFVRVGAKIVFADSGKDNPNIDASLIESLVTPRTRVIVVVHYAGVACDMEAIMDIAHRHGLLVVEDAAQAIDSYYNGRPLGSFGQFAAFSFHETKNITSGEGGALIINDERYIRRAEIIWEKGTNRAEFYRGEVDKYNWRDTGSSFLPSEMTAAFLCAQLEHLDDIQSRRLAIWNRYFTGLQNKALSGRFNLPDIPSFATNNAHMFYLVCPSPEERNGLLSRLKKEGIMAVSHYMDLHDSPFYAARHDGRILPEAKRYENCLLRLPLYYDLDDAEIDRICALI